MSGQWGNPSVRRRWSPAFGPKSRRGSPPETRSAAGGSEVAAGAHAGDPVVGEMPGTVRAEHDGAVAVRAHHDEPNPGMLDERADETRVQRFDLADREPILSLGEGDQPEATRREDHGRVARGVHERVLDGVPVRPEDNGALATPVAGRPRAAFGAP